MTAGQKACPAIFTRKVFEMENGIEKKNFYTDVKQQNEVFFLKGSNALDWGMKNRFSRIFQAGSGKTVMLAIDHGYFQGPTTGLERVDISIRPLLPYADTLMLTRGILRSVIPPTFARGVVLRASGGPSILREELSDEQIAMDMDDAIRLNAAGVGIQVFIGGEHETRQPVFLHTTLPVFGAQKAPPRRKRSHLWQDQIVFFSGCHLLPSGFRAISRRPCSTRLARPPGQADPFEGPRILRRHLMRPHPRVADPGREQQQRQTDDVVVERQQVFLKQSEV